MLDVSVALTNPYTLDRFSVLRRQEAINGFGEVIPGAILFNGIPGVVYDEESESLDRRPDVDVQGKNIIVITNQFPIRGASVDSGGVSWQPDLVIWNGNSYLADRPGDWSKYAAGFVKMKCCLWDSSPIPPTLFSFTVGALGPANPLLKTQSYVPTIVSSTILTLPLSPNIVNLLVFKNGILLQPPAGFALSGNTITLTVPLIGTDTVVIYA